MFSPALLIIFLGLSLGLILTYIPVIGIERDIPDISLFFTFYALAIIGIRVLGSNLLEKNGSLYLLCGGYTVPVRSPVDHGILS